MKRRRWRKFIVVTGSMLSLLIAVAFVVSAWIVIQFPLSRGLAMTLYAGSISVTDQSVTGNLSLHSSTLSLWNLWYARRTEPKLAYAFALRPVKGYYFVAVPFYTLFLAVAIPTLLVWRFVPKFPRGHCRRCGYNLTGLTEARCPECGAGFGTGAMR